MAQTVNPELVRNLKAFYKSLEDPPIAYVDSAGGTSNPPTAAQLNSLFGSASTDLPNGFIGVVEKAAGTANTYLVFTAGGSWYRIAATAA